MEMCQGDVDIQARVPLIAIDMEDITLVGEVPGLAVDCGGIKQGWFPFCVGLVRNLLHGLVLEALRVVAQLVTLGMAEGKQDDKLHTLHYFCSGLRVHPAHAQPADPQRQSF